MKGSAFKTHTCANLDPQQTTHFNKKAHADSLKTIRQDHRNLFLATCLEL